MIPVLILSHGDLARELLVAARNIDPHLEEAVVAVTLPWEVDTDAATKDLKRRVRELQGSEGVLILTDMFGGTATNLALPFLEPGKVEVVTGANLPMLVKLAALRDTDLDLHELAQRLASTGQKSIRLASEFLRRHTRE